MKRLHAYIYGLVQGVGFRYFVLWKARQYGLTGFVRNLSDGSVEVVAEGDEDALKMLLDDLKHGPPAASVTDVKYEWQPPSGSFHDFRITY